MYEVCIMAWIAVLALIFAGYPILAFGLSALILLA
jgi:hypothetical protein